MNEIVVTRGERLAARRVGGEMVILSADDSSLYVLNELGSLLWEAADGRTPLREIVENVVCPAFEVDADTAVGDALDFLKQLEAFGIVALTGAPASAGDHVEGQ
jgi:coenzyme PQQ synthesis protein D (PqqD)